MRHRVLAPRRIQSATSTCSLQEAFPHPATPEQAACVELLGPVNERITGQALGAMAAGDAARLGALMREAQVGGACFGAWGPE